MSSKIHVSINVLVIETASPSHRTGVNYALLLRKEVEVLT